MQAQATRANNTRPVLPHPQAPAHPHSVGDSSSMPIELVDSDPVGRQPPPPAQTLPTPPYSSWGARAIPNASTGSSSRLSAPSAFVDPGVGHGGQNQMRQAQRRETRDRTASLPLMPSSATLTAPMASSYPPVSAGAFDLLAALQGQAGQQHDSPPSHPPQQPTQIAHNPSRQIQANVQRASAIYIPQQPQRAAPPADQRQGFAGQHPSVYSLPYHRQIQVPAQAAVPPQGSSTAPNRPPVPPAQATISHSSAAVTSRPSSSASHPHSSPNIPSPIDPSHQLHPAPSRQEHPSASTGMQGNVALLPAPQRAPRSASSLQDQVPAQQQRPQQSQQPHQPRILPPEHPAMQRAQEILRYTTSHLEKAYNYAMYGVSSELDRLNEQYWAECKRLQDLYRQAEQEKTALREERNKWFNELVREKAAHDVTRAQFTKANNAAKQLVTYLQNSVPQVDALLKENRHLKAENELLKSVNRPLVESVFDRVSLQSPSSTEVQSREPIEMVQLGEYSMPRAVLSLLERAVKEPLIQQYEQRLAEALLGQARGGTSKEPAPSRGHPSATRAQPEEHATPPVATPLTPSEPASREPPATGPAGLAEVRLATPNPESPARCPLPAIPLSLGPSLSRRRDPQPTPLNQLRRSASIVPSDTYTHSDSIPTPPRTVTPPEPPHITSMFSVKEEPVEAPIWPWAAGETIDLTGLSDSPLPADLTPLPLDLGQLEVQFGDGDDDAMDVDLEQSAAADIGQSDEQSVPQAAEPTPEPERKRHLDDDPSHDGSEGEGARKKLKVEHSDEEEEEEAVMEELEPSTGREVDELTEGMTSTQPTTPPSPMPLAPGPPEPDPIGTSPTAAKPALPSTVEEDQPAASDQTSHPAPVPPVLTSPTEVPLPDPIPPDVPTLPSVPDPQLAPASESVPEPILEPSIFAPSIQAPPLPIASTAEAPQAAIKPEPRDPSLPGARPASPKLSLRHLALIYHTDREQRTMTCRMCLQRKRFDPEWVVKRLPSSASWDELSGHCRDVHPRSLTKLLEMPDAQLQETRQRLVTSNC